MEGLLLKVTKQYSSGVFTMFVKCTSHTLTQLGWTGTRVDARHIPIVKNVRPEDSVVIAEFTRVLEEYIPSADLC